MTADGRTTDSSYRSQKKLPTVVKATTFPFFSVFTQEENPPAETSARHHSYALYCRMEKSSSVQHSHPPKSRVTPRKEREKGAVLPPKSHRQRPSKTGRVPQASSVRLQREKPETSEATMEQETEVKVKSSTVVDIDSVREDEVKEENLGLLEAAEQDDGKRKSRKEEMTCLRI